MIQREGGRKGESSPLPVIKKITGCGNFRLIDMTIYDPSVSRSIGGTGRLLACTGTI